jgi:hypothetical protein
VTRPNVNDARSVALFASGLQPSVAPAPEAVAEAINRAIRRLGVRGCVGRMAHEFGDHPDAAATRMRWARQLAVLTQASVPGGRGALMGRRPGSPSPAMPAGGTWFGFRPAPFGAGAAGGS